MIRLRGTGTLTDRLVRGIVQAIQDESVPLGARLPAQRVLAQQVEVSRNVVVAAFERLRSEGYVQTRRGAGTFVCPEVPAERIFSAPKPVHFETPPAGLSKRALRIRRAFASERPKWAPSARTSAIDFRYGPPAFRDLPFETFCRLVGRRHRQATRRQLDYGAPTGALELRRALSRHLARARGVRCRAEQVIVTQGTQESLRLAAQVLIDPGDRVLFEDPGYLPARQTLLAHGARVVRARVDEQGLVPGALRSSGAVPRMVYVTPSHQFPTGVVMPEERRVALLRRASEAKAFVFEDDYDGGLHHRGAPIPSLQGLDADGRVLYSGSLSKSLFPALRLGYLVVPEALMPAFEAEKLLGGGSSNTPVQQAVADFISGGHLDRHIRRTRMACGERRTALVEAVAQTFGASAEIGGVAVGHHALLWLHDVPVSAAPTIRRRARAMGVGVYPISPFYGDAPPKAGFLLGFAGLEPERIREGISRLGRAVAGA